MSSSRKIIVILMGGIVLMLSIFVLLKKQPDTLAQYVPEQSELYFHANTNALKTLDNDLQQKISALLNVDNILLNKLRSAEEPEIGLFYYQNDYFIVTRTNGEALAKKLAVQPAAIFKTHRKFFDFSNFQLYSKKMPDFLANFADATDELNTVYGTITNKTVCLTSNSPKFLTNNPAFIQPAALIKTVYANGLVLNNNLTRHADTLAQPTLLSAFLAKISGPMETILLQDNDFVLGFDTQINPTTKIKQILATYSPKKQAKTLPDGTISYNLIADPTVFIEKQTGNNSIELANNTEPVLYIKQQNKKTFIANKPTLLELVQPTSLFNKPTIDIINKNIKAVGTQSFCGKLRVCID
jgi:hypothetical protein